MRKFLSYLVFIIPLVAWMSCGILYMVHDNEHIAKGECLKTFIVEHWHKRSAPTYTTHTVMLYNNKAFVVDGNCESGTISWIDEHPYIYGAAVLSTVPWAFALIFAIAFIIVVMFGISMFIQNPREFINRIKSKFRGKE